MKKKKRRQDLQKCFVEKNPAKVLLVLRIPLQEFFLVKESRKFPPLNFELRKVRQVFFGAT